MTDVLASHRIGQEGAPEVWVLHGILGSARNWRAFTRRLHRERPDLAFRLIDLRRHGDSPDTLPPPDTLEACVEDLDALADHLGVRPVALVGHSFGGKVALLRAGRPADGLQQVWVLDSRPGPMSGGLADHEVGQVILALMEIPMPVEGHDVVRDALLARGFSTMLAQWMTTNLRSLGREAGYTWRFDLGGVRRLIEDYARVDARPVLDDPVVPVEVVRAGRGERFTDAEAARLSHARVRDHLLPDSGHWVHVDAPDALRRLFVQYLPR